MKLEVKISGGRSDRLEGAITDFLQAQFGEQPTRSQHAEPAPRREGTTIAVIGLLLSLPGAIGAAMQLAEKVKLKERIGVLLERVRDAASEDDDVVILTIDDQTPIDLKTATVETVADALEGAGKSE